MWPMAVAWKRCKKCGRIKPRDEFRRSCHGRDGFGWGCKSCHNEKRRKRYAEDQVYRKDILKWQREQYARDPTIKRKRAQEWKKANPEKKRALDRRWEEANRPKLRERLRQWKLVHKDRVRESNRKSRERRRSHHQEYNRQWARDNPEKCCAKQHRRRARKRDLPQDLTMHEWHMTLAAFDQRCAYCRQPPSATNCPQYGKLAQEHVVSVKRAGGYTLGNIVPACEQCNASKATRNHEEWMGERGYDVELFRSYVGQLTIA